MSEKIIGQLQLLVGTLVRVDTEEGRVYKIVGDQTSRIDLERTIQEVKHALNASDVVDGDGKQLNLADTSESDVDQAEAIELLLSDVSDGLLGIVLHPDVNSPAW